MSLHSAEHPCPSTAWGSQHHRAQPQGSCSVGPWLGQRYQAGWEIAAPQQPPRGLLLHASGIKAPLTSPGSTGGGRFSHRGGHAIFPQHSPSAPWHNSRESIRAGAGAAAGLLTSSSVCVLKEAKEVPALVKDAGSRGEASHTSCLGLHR